MKRKDIFLFEIISTIFIIFLGFILHFLYEWTNNNIIVASFSAINESTWEHLKLLFFPMLITIIIGTFIFRNSNYLCVKTKGLLLGLSFILVFFYTYTGILGYNISILDIGSFIISVLISEYYSYKKFKYENCNKTLFWIILFVLFFSFVIFTYKTPKIGIFKDPVDGSFGIKEKERKFLSN